jgi:hypothetical protein
VSWSYFLEEVGLAKIAGSLHNPAVFEIPVGQHITPPDSDHYEE